MIFNRKYPLIQMLLIITVGLAEEYRFPLSSDDPVRFKVHHWQHPQSNSAMDINGIEIDVFQYQAAVEIGKTIDVDLVSPVWEYAGWTSDEIALPEVIEISKVLIV